MTLEEIIAIRNEIGCGPFAQEHFQPLEEMQAAFQTGAGTANLDSWKPDLLAAIDACFVDSFMTDGEPATCLFSVLPACAQENEVRFRGYYDAVDYILARSPNMAPPYAREYFAMFTVWYRQGWYFPIPLVTASVVECLHKIASRVRVGMVEVSALPAVIHPYFIRS